ncbi:hypothetical protein, partial [Klebsiella quasipneumoniae]|uniref:hypothetical protein n=1 Tax=Klebsiella quasipneumoniae TaxID=1463165 RepID=UPI002FFA13AC
AGQGDSRRPAKLQVPCLISCPAALRLRGPTGYEPVRGPCRPGKTTAATRHNGWSRVDNYPDSRESRVRATG